MSLNETGRRNRIAYDWQIFQRMRGDVFDGEAYRTTADLEQQREPIQSQAEAQWATKYRVDFAVKTLVGPDMYAPITTIGFDLDTGDYPYSEPATWVISQHVPYSPHFRRGAPVCLGEIWRDADGMMLLGKLMVHVAKLLNWDEEVRGGGYRGWNGEAIAYHQQHFGDRPLTPGLRYPALPADLTHGVAQGEATFAPAGRSAGPRLLSAAPQSSGDLFQRRGRVAR